MQTTFTKSGSVWVERESGELLTDDDISELLARLPDAAVLRIVAADLDDDDDETLADAFGEDA